MVAKGLGIFVDQAGSNDHLYGPPLDIMIAAKGFYELRQEYRTFRIDRIRQAIDPESAEIIDDVTHYLLDEYQQSPGYIISKTIENLSIFLRYYFMSAKPTGN